MMFVYLKMPEVGMQGQKKGQRHIGGEVRAREGFFFFFFNIMYLLI